jgi:hypothetical protein
MILIFITQPINLLNLSFLTKFYLIFSILFISLFITNFISNFFTKNKKIFDNLFISILEISSMKKIYIRTFYKYLDYSELYKYRKEKILLKSIFLLFNSNKYKFQVLVQFRPPLILLIIISYLIVFFIRMIA